MAKKIPDEGTFPDSRGEALDRAGLKDTGYHDKKGAPTGQRVGPSTAPEPYLNHLPPGMNIEDQHLSEAHRGAEMPMRHRPVGVGYSSDPSSTWGKKP